MNDLVSTILKLLRDFGVVPLYAQVLLVVLLGVVIWLFPKIKWAEVGETEPSKINPSPPIEMPSERGPDGEVRPGPVTLDQTPPKDYL